MQKLELCLIFTLGNDVQKASENLNISDVSDSKIIVGNYYIVDKYDTKVVVLDADDAKNKAKVTADLVSKTSGFWINYNKLIPYKSSKIFTNM